MNRLPLIALAAVFLLAASGCVDRERQAQNERTKEIIGDPTVPVSVLAVFPQTINDEVEITGQFQVNQDSVIGAQVSGRLSQVFVQEGSVVSAGQTIARMESRDQESMLRQALSQVDAARAQLKQAQSDAVAAPQRSAASVRSAQAKVAQAKQVLAKLRNGSRNEEKAQADIAVARADSDMKTAKIALDRARRLLNEGAIAKADVEDAENRYDNTLAAYKSALENRSLVQDPTRTEDLRVAEQDLVAAQEALRIEKTNRSLDVTYKDRVDAARANVRSAEEGVTLARKALEETTIKAPYAGRIVDRPAQTGVVLNPGSPVARIVSSDSIYFEAQVPENKVSQISAGTPVNIQVDALGGSTLRGTVVLVNPMASSVARLYAVRVKVLDSAAMLKPGMFGKGSLIVGRQSGIYMLPDESVKVDGNTGTVMVIEGEKAKQVKVQPGRIVGSKVIVRGLTPGAKVVIRGQEGLLDGAKVRIEDPKAVEADAAEAPKPSSDHS